jgi:hypothetical protein
MKNITLAIDEEVLAAVRKYAAAHETTVNGLVRDYLKRLASTEDKAAKARQELLKLAERSTLDLGGRKWNREELYDRGLLSRHEHPALRGFAEPERGGEEGNSD